MENEKNKKKTAKKIVIILILVVLIVLALYMYSRVNTNQTTDTVDTASTENVVATNETETGEATNTSEGENTETETGTGSKILVVYYSAQNHTEAVAQQIAENLGADIFELTPVDEYTSEDLNWNDENSRVTREHEDESLRDVELQSTTVDNWDEYDTVLIGYPIWWGIAAWPVDTFVKANDFNGKTVIPFCTSSSSGLGQSGDLLAEEANGGNWLEGYRFRSNPSDSDIQEWTDSIQESIQ